MKDKFSQCPICESKEMRFEEISEYFAYKGFTLIIDNYKIVRCVRCSEEFIDDTEEGYQEKIEKQLIDFRNKINNLNIPYSTTDKLQKKYLDNKQEDDSWMWEHNCPEEGEISIGKGEPCNWCGKKEESIERIPHSPPKPKGDFQVG